MQTFAPDYCQASVPRNVGVLVHTLVAMPRTTGDVMPTALRNSTNMRLASFRTSRWNKYHDPSTVHRGHAVELLSHAASFALTLQRRRELGRTTTISTARFHLRCLVIVALRCLRAPPVFVVVHHVAEVNAHHWHVVLLPCLSERAQLFVLHDGLARGILGALVQRGEH